MAFLIDQNLQITKRLKETYSFSKSSALLNTLPVSVSRRDEACALNLKTIIATTATSRIYSVEVCPLSSFK